MSMIHLAIGAYPPLDPNYTYATIACVERISIPHIAGEIKFKDVDAAIRAYPPLP